MPTPVFLCGAECGIAAAGTASAGVEHWSAVNGTPTVVTSHLFTSARAFRFNSTGSPVTLTNTFGTSIASPSSQPTRFKFYFAGSLPSGSCHIARQQTLNGGAVQYSAVTGKIGLGSTAGSPNIEGPVIAADTVYEVSYMVRRDNAIGTTWWLTVDGVDYGNVTTAGISAAGPNLMIGIQDTGITADLYMDDIITSGTAADYPITSGIVAGLYPVSDKTNNAANPSTGNNGHFFSATSDFGKGAGGATATEAQNVEATSWQSLANPLSTSIGTNFIADKLGAAGEQLCWDHGLLPDATAVNGVMGVVTTHSASATANAMTVGITNSVASRLTIVNNLDLSEATITVPVGILATQANGGAWTPASLRDGSNWIYLTASDVNPDVYLDGVCLEVDYVPVIPLPHTNVYAQTLPH